MYTLSSWRNHLGIVAVDFLHQELARTVGDPFTAYVPGEVTQVSRMTNLHPKLLDKSPGYRGSRLFFACSNDKPYNKFSSIGEKLFMESLNWLIVHKHIGHLEVDKTIHVFYIKQSFVHGIAHAH